MAMGTNGLGTAEQLGPINNFRKMTSLLKGITHLQHEDLN